MRRDGADLFREEVRTEGDSAQRREYGTPASKEEPSSGDDRVAHKGAVFFDRGSSRAVYQR